MRSERVIKVEKWEVLKNKKKRKKIDWEREKIMGDINGLTCAKRISKRFELLDFGIIPKSCTY